MTKNEAAYLAAFLEEIRNRLGNDGCNDMLMADTPGNRQLLLDADKGTDMEEERGEIPLSGDGKILTGNTHILSYLMRKFMEEYGLTRKDLPDLWS